MLVVPTAPSWSSRLIPGTLLPHGRFAWWYFLLGLIVLAGGIVGAAWIQTRWMTQAGISQHLGFMLYGPIFIGTALLTPVLASGRLSRHDYPAPDRLPHWRWGVVGAMSVVVQIAVAMFEFIVQGARGASETVARSLGLGQAPWSDVAVVLAVTVMAPLGEELLFRGLFFRSLRDGLARWLPLPWGAGLGIVFSSLLFAVVHVGDGQITQWPALFIMGVLLALTYEWTGSLLAPMLVHALNNTFALLVTLTLPEVTFSAEWLLMLTLSAPLIVAGSGTLLLRHLPLPTTPPPLPRPAAAPPPPGPAHPPDPNR